MTPLLVAFGDSITYGHGTTGYQTSVDPSTPSPRAFPFVAGTALGAPVRDLGIGGTTAAQILAQEVPGAPAGATYVSIEAGTNDILHFGDGGSYGVETLAQREADHLALCQAVRTKYPTARIAVITMPDQLPSPYGVSVAAYDVAIRANAAAIGASVVDIETNAAMNSESNYFDGIHPNDQGAAILGGLVAAAL